MAKVGIGIVGTGHRGPQLAARVAEMEDAELIAVCDIVPALAEAVAAEYGAKAFATVEEMVEEPGLDAVEVVTPSVHHAHPTIVAAKAGKHVAVATPFAVTLDECDRMIAAAEESGVNLMFAQTHRYSANEHRAKRLIDDGEIGDVIWATWTRMRSANPRWRLSAPTGPPDRWSRWRKSGGGLLRIRGHPPHGHVQVVHRKRRGNRLQRRHGRVLVHRGRRGQRHRRPQVQVRRLRHDKRGHLRPGRPRPRLADRRYEGNDRDRGRGASGQGRLDDGRLSSGGRPPARVRRQHP